jgi:hypothetical protein
VLTSADLYLVMAGFAVALICLIPRAYPDLPTACGGLSLWMNSRNRK